MESLRSVKEEIEGQYLRRTQDLEASTRTLEASRATLQAALASMTDAIFISDDQGRFVDLDDAFATFHKFRNKEECGKSLADYPAILDVFLADGSRAPLEQWAVPRALRGETGLGVEYTHPEGHRRGVGRRLGFAPIRNAAGAIVGSVVVGRDISLRKQAEKVARDQEARLRLAVRSANIGLWDWDLATNSVYLARMEEPAGLW